MPMEETHMDIQKIISLVTKTQGLIKNREMAAHVKEKGLADYVTQVDIAVQNFLKKELFALDVYKRQTIYWLLPCIGLLFPLNIRVKVLEKLFARRLCRFSL